MAPLFKALSFVLQGNPNVLLLDYTHKETFHDLWLCHLPSKSRRIPAQRIDWDNPNLTVLIIGNLPPSDAWPTLEPRLQGINFHAHLTAASWMAAWRIQFPDLKARVVVLTSQSETIGPPISQAMAAILGAKVHDGSPLVPGTGLLKSPSLDTLCADLKAAPSLRDSPTENTQCILRSTLRDGLISDREAHHSASNVLGALLLSDDNSEPKGLAQDYLLTLARSCWHDSSSAKKPRLEFPWTTPELRNALKGALLIDDMAEVWTPFLSGALGYSQSDKTFAPLSEKLEILPERLTAFLESKRQFASPIDLAGVLGPADEIFVLFLDLRLFSPGTDAEDVQHKFFEKLARFGLKLLEREHLPWLKGDNKEKLLAELNRCLPGAPESPLLHPRETLLPRLLSLLDPTLPIILFSSTHRSDLIDPFRDYGNIVTAFHKPILREITVAWAETLKGLRADFISSLKQAEKILRLRRAIRRLHERSAATNGGTKAVLPKGDHGYHIDVFFDESQQDRSLDICAGGVVLIRALTSDAGTVVSDQEIFDALKSNCGLWGWSPETEEGDYPERTLVKGRFLDFAPAGDGLRTVEQALNTIKTTLGESGSIFPFAAIGMCGVNFPAWMDIPEELAGKDVEISLDDTLLNLEQHIIDGLLFHSELIRPALEHKNTRIAIDTATRHIPHIQRLEALWRNFGIEYESEGNGLFNRKTIRWEDGHRITAAVIKRTGLSWPRLDGKIHRARGVTLTEFQKAFPTDRPLPHQLHYLADWIAHICVGDPAVTTQGQTFAPFISSGWIADFRDIHKNSNPPVPREESARFESWRKWCRGDRVGAILSAASLLQPQPPNGIGINPMKLLAEGTATLTGPDLLDLFSRLPPAPEVDNQATTDAVGSDCTYEPDNWRIRDFPNREAYENTTDKWWLTRIGISVRIFRSGRVVAFAHLTQCKDFTDPLFYVVEPRHRSLFKNGSPGGDPYTSETP